MLNAGIEPAGPVTETSAAASDYWELALRESTALLAVDLDAADVDLKSAFAAWLADRREGRAIWKVDTAAFRNWAQAQVVPYLDVHLYKEATGARITQASIALALFPDDAEGQGVERLKKVTMAHAKKLMSEEAIALLSGKLGAQAAGREPFDASFRALMGRGSGKKQ